MVDNTQYRTRTMMQAIGWQGGTVHQLSEAIGLTVDAILYRSPQDRSFASRYTLGWMRANTGPLPLTKEDIDKHRGDIEWWLGIADGIWQKEDQDADKDQSADQTHQGG